MGDSRSPVDVSDLHEYYARQMDDEYRWYARSRRRHRRQGRIDLIRRVWQCLKSETLRVLDIGCGDGFVVAQVMRADLPARYVGVDLSPHKLHRVLERFPAPLGATVQADAAHLPLAEGCVDCVLCMHMLEHVPDPAAVLADMKRVLRPGGHVLLCVPVQSTLQPRWPLTNKVPVDGEFAEHITPFSTRGALDLARGGGFSVRKIAHHGFRFPLWGALGGHLPYRLYAAVDRWLCRIPLDLFGVKGRLGIGRASLMLVLERPS